ncbi:hypothetical protein ACJX0J_021171 [Zea mays]
MNYNPHSGQLLYVETFNLLTIFTLNKKDNFVFNSSNEIECSETSFTFLENCPDSLMSWFCKHFKAWTMLAGKNLLVSIKFHSPYTMQKLMINIKMKTYTMQKNELSSSSLIILFNKQ